VTEINMIWAWLQTRRYELLKEVREGSDRGEIVQTAIMIGLFAAATIVIVGILVAKAKDAANSVKTQ
jgi:hypothetical protein